MRELLHSVALRAARYLEDIQQRRVSPSAEAVRDLSQFDEPLPEGPTAPEDVIRMLDEVGSPATMGIAGRRFFGFVIGGSLPAALGANWLASAWDQNAGLFAATPISATLEEVSLRWLLDALGLPEESGGAFVTGATMANFTALAAARRAVLESVGWDVEARGLFGAPEIPVVVGEEAHPSVIKSLGMLGMGRERVVRVPVDGQGRMLAGALPELTTPSIVCVQVGNVNTGSFDPVGEICRRAHEAGAWVLEAAHRIGKEVGARVDDREGQTPGAKFFHWERRGVPLVVELGPRDLASGNAVLKRRDTGVKEVVP